MDTVDRSRRAAIAAARDAEGKARMLAEGLEALARALDTMAVELPPAGWPGAGVGEPLAREGEPWTTVEVARYLKTTRSWVYQATASGRLPSIRVGHLRRFEPSKIRAWANANASGSVPAQADQAQASRGAARASVKDSRRPRAPPSCGCDR